MRGDTLRDGQVVAPSSGAALLSLLDTLPCGIALLDSDHRVVQANHRFAGMVGVDPEAIPGRTLASLRVVPPVAGGLDDLPWSRPATGGNGRNGGNGTAEAALAGVRRGGLRVRVVPVPADGASPVRAAVVVDEPREADLEELRRRDLAWTVSVTAACAELRTPLTVLAMQAALMSTGTAGAMVANVAILDRNLRRLQTAVEDLHALVLDRGGDGRLDPSFDLAAVALEVAAEQTHGALRGSVDVLVGRDLQVMGDRGRMADSLGHLLAAVRRDAGPGGFVVLESQAHPAEVELCVRAVRSDNGHLGSNGTADSTVVLGLRVARELLERQGYRTWAVPDAHALCFAVPRAPPLERPRTA